MRFLVYLHSTTYSSFVFFFSSRRRHTRLVSDWSSDVCSSDLPRDCGLAAWSRAFVEVTTGSVPGFKCRCRRRPLHRSEERRVGKECRSRWSWDHEKKNNGRK